MHAVTRPFGRALAVVAVVAVAAVCLVAPSALAQTSEMEQLGTELAHTLFEAADLDAAMTAGMNAELPELGKAFAEIGGRPEWTAMVMEAAKEELAADRPALERIMGREFVHDFTPAELRAGITFLKSPSGVAMLKAATAQTASQPAPPMTRAVQKDIERFMRTPEGRAFMDKFAKVGDSMEGAKSDILAEIFPGLLRRFGEKAEAAEKAREAAR
ncbi:hypothetical protein [Caulobacter sp. 17J65-9]|uniref:hypothetical protein n=1 Tax=Caulobacter sp. 17J65-9 TaxID=2709382 RepID=UPI0013CAA313|nr:hypothetical protein [Caulobacter sp. 17J65-9]NEX92474.1 hypothetical protein [Caulobacter sp. 17J65-9]